MPHDNENIIHNSGAEIQAAQYIDFLLYMIIPLLHVNGLQPQWNPIKLAVLVGRWGSSNRDMIDVRRRVISFGLEAESHLKSSSLS